MFGGLEVGGLSQVPSRWTFSLPESWLISHVPQGTGESKEERSKDATPLVKANMDRHMPGRYADKRVSRNHPETRFHFFALDSFFFKFGGIVYLFLIMFKTSQQKLGSFHLILVFRKIRQTFIVGELPLF